ncbi:MAG: condensation domain-containing protein, partial [Candidatus Dormiibacterota bacterium]
MIDEHEPALSAAKQTLLERRIQGWTADGPAGRLTGQVGAADTAPLSPAQEQLWHFSHLAPGNPVYNESVSIRKVGPLNLGALQATFNELLRRHQIWRTTFEVVDGEPRQVVHPVPSLQIPLVDLSDVAPADAEREAIRMAAEAARRPYDLAQGPLIRPLMVRFAADHHRLYLAMHHLIFDGVSLYRVILPELIALYDAFSAGLPSPLTEPALQYGDYAASERTDAAAQERSQALKYWRKHLSDAPSLALPLDHRRPATQQFRGGMEPVHIPKDLADGLDRLGRKEGGTFFQVIATAFAVLMQRYSGQDDVIFGTASDLRRRPELEAMVGYCLTPLVVRADLGGDPTFVEALGRVRGLLLDGLDHTVPFEHVVRDLGPRRDPGANPIFQAMLVLEPPSSSPHPEWSLHQMEVEVGNAVGHAKFDLHLELDRRPEGHVSGRLIYNSDLFDRDTARRMRDHWSALLRGIAEGPSRRVSELPLLTEEDRRVQLTSRHSAGVETPPGMSIHELVAVQAERVPDKVAIEFQEQLLTYRQLESQAEQLARRLRAAGVKPGSVVGLCLERSLEMVVGMLGILKLGAAYIPLDPLYPRERIAFVVADAGAQVILTQRSLVGSLPLNTGKAVCIDEPAETEEVLKGASSPELVLPGALAYVLYTSGSTGRPKGVRVSHANVVNLMTAMPQALGVGQDDAVLAVASYSFDMSVGDVWPTLGVGARLVVASPRVAAEAGRLGQLIKDSGTTIMHATPATWQMLVDNGWEGAPKLVAVSGG